MSKEALKLALEALETCYAGDYSTGHVIDPSFDEDAVKEAIIAIKEVLAQPEQERCVGCEACIDTACGRDECPKGWPKAAQPEQEPVAWMNPYGGVSLRLFTGLEKNSYTIPLYTTPPQRTWVGLTEEDRLELYKKFTDSDEWTYEKAIEAKLKEKNT